MKKNGMSLIEVTVSIALITILAVSVAGIIALSYDNVSANGISINSLNDAKASLDITMSNKEATFSPPVGVVVANDERTYANLNATIKMRYVTSEILDPTGKGVASNEIIYAFQDINIPLETTPDVYLDKNLDGIFTTGIDEEVILSRLGHMGSADNATFTVPSGQNLIFNGSVYLESNRNNYGVISNYQKNCLLKLIINATNSDVIFKENSKLVCNGGVTINAKNIIMKNSQISSPRQWTYAWNFNISPDYIWNVGTVYAIPAKATYVSIILNASKKLVIDCSDVSGPYIKLTGSDRLEIINGSDITMTGHDTHNYQYRANLLIDSSDILIYGNKDNPTLISMPEDGGDLSSDDLYYTQEYYYVMFNYLRNSSYKIQIGDKSRGGIYTTKSYVQFVRARTSGTAIANQLGALTHWEAMIDSNRAQFQTGVSEGIAPTYRDSYKRFFKVN